jgi:hypothetical protein
LINAPSAHLRRKSLRSPARSSFWRSRFAGLISIKNQGMIFASHSPEIRLINGQAAGYKIGAAQPAFSGGFPGKAMQKLHNISDLIIR